MTIAVNIITNCIISDQATYVFIDSTPPSVIIMKVKEGKQPSAAWCALPCGTSPQYYNTTIFAACQLFGKLFLYIAAKMCYNNYICF